jgi:hypothetical protein
MTELGGIHGAACGTIAEPSISSMAVSSSSLTVVFVIGCAALTSACRSTGAVPRPFPTPGQGLKSTGTSPGSPPDTYALTGTALALRGVPYRNGGSDPNGFDCSGFTQYVFRQYGVTLPRDVGAQFARGNAVKLDRIAPGDLVFFTTVAAGASHVGIALGGDEFVHAPSSNGVVRVERFSAAYWSRRFVGARRIN